MRIEVLYMSEEKELLSPRRIFPEDREVLRQIAFEKDTSYIEVLKEVLEYAKIQNRDIEYYEQFEKHTTPSSEHKSVRIPDQMNQYLNEKATKKLPAKSLLSALIQDYIHDKQQ